ncbi:unnamed protein product [Scytosiphon promiscuus]
MTAELFPHDVPVRGTSLERHGLVDLSASAGVRRTSAVPPSSEDLTDADRGEEQWATSGVAGGDAIFQALVGVNSVVVGHARAAEELLAILLSPPSPRDSRKPRARATAVARQNEQTINGEERVRSQSGSRSTFSPPLPSAADSVARQRAGSTAGVAAASAMAAVRRGDRPFYAGSANGASRRSGDSPEETPQPTGAVSMANLLDISVSLFGSNRDGGRRRQSSGSNGATDAGSTSTGNKDTSAGSRGGKSSGAIDRYRRHEKLVTFTVDVHTGGSKTLGVTVKELGGGAVFVEDVRKLPGGCSGPAELAGILVGDVILGINYAPLERGLVHTSTVLADAIAQAGFVKLQISRAVRPTVRHNSWRRSLPEKDCALVTELVWRTAQLRKTGVLSSAERQSMAALILQRMAWEEGTLGAPAPLLAPAPPVASALLDSLVLQVKGLRKAISVRCLHVKSTTNASEDWSVWGPPTVAEAAACTTAKPEAATPASARVTVRYILRAEDVGTGRQWLVFPQYNDLSELHQGLLAMWPPIADLPFPAKRLAPRATAQGMPAGARAEVGETILEEHLVRLETFLDGALTLLGIYVSIDPRCSGALRLVQDFLGKPRDLPSAETALSPPLREQKRMELLLYKLLNQVDSPASRMKHLLMRDFESEALMAPDVESLMTGTSSRLRRLQEFVLEEHEEQLSSCANSTSGETETIVRKAVRRQVELSLFLPLRRCLWKELARRLRGPARILQRAMKALRGSSPAVFGVESSDVLTSEKWGPAKEAMGQATRTVLPIDQTDGLRRASEHIAALHASLQQRVRASSAHQHSGEGSACDGTSSRPVAFGVMGCPSGSSLEPDNQGGESTTCVEDMNAEWEEFSLPGGEPRSQDRDTFDQLRNGGGGGGGNGIDLANESSVQQYAPVYSTGQEQQEGNRGNAVERIGGSSAPAPALLSHVDKPPGGRRSAQTGHTKSPANAAVGDAPFRPSLDGNVCRRNTSAFREGIPAPVESPNRWSGVVSFDKDAARKIDDPNRDGSVQAPAGEMSLPAPSVQPDEAMGADDFLPLFAYVLVHSAPIDLLLPQTLLTHLMDADGSLSEAGYLVATLEAAVSFVTQVYSSSLSADE